MRRVRFCMLLTGLLMAGHALADDGWQKIKEDARGQTVWFNA